MKRRLGSSDSLGAALMSICPSAEEDSPQNTNIYCRGFQSILDGLDEEGCIDDSVHITEKKRRLSYEQVKALEKNFEVENKLQPERKVKLAQELGLQPRQVAVWFQNRRARWKTKQLERDYGILKASYDTLMLNSEFLQRGNQALLSQIKEMKAKLNDENRESNHPSIKEEVISQTENKVTEKIETPIDAAPDSAELDNDEADNNVLIFRGLKEGSSDDSDSSAILNEDNRNSPNAAISSSMILRTQNQIVMPPNSSSHRFNSSSPIPKIQFSDSRLVESNCSHKAAYQWSQLVKVEESCSFLNGDESCNFFSDEQAPSLHWYCPDQWS